MFPSSQAVFPALPPSACTRGRTRSVSAAPALEASARVRGVGLRRSGSGEPQQTRGSINGAIPIAGWFIVENPMKMDDLGTPILGNLQISELKHQFLGLPANIRGTAI